MASLKTIKKRIGVVKNTQKITKAMKMVAAAKLRRAQQAAVQARDYVRAIQETAGRLLTSQPDLKHPLTTVAQTVKTREYLVLTSDRGLCGGFNSGLLRKVEGEVQKCKTEKIETSVRMIGKKGRDYFKAKGLNLAESATGLYEKFNRSIAEEIGNIAIHRFEAQKTDEVWLAFNLFKSAMVQQVALLKVLPIQKVPGTFRHLYIYEPNAPTVLDKVLKEAVVAQIYSAFLESVASELAARMTAMDNATNNASDMISYLTLVFNRARQATITKELMDIVNAAEALR